MKLFLLPLFFFIAVASAVAQSIRINEFMAANATSFPENHDFDDYTDWIELQNTTGSSISLNDYYLSDDPTVPLRWKFPAGATIPANGFFIVRADGFDIGPGQSVRRDSAPWDNFTTTAYHTNFKLGSTGESVVLTQLDAPSQNETYVALGANWKYFDQGSLPDPNWFSTGFSDTSWASGAAELGYGDDDEATVVDFGPSSSNKYPTTYFRTSFNVTNPAVITSLDCSAKIDDGAVIYLNGTEIARVRMDAGPVGYADFANDDGPEGQFESVSIPVSALVAGTNVLAIEVHQGDGSSSDISLDVEITGVESTGTPVTVDSISFGEQIDDVSYGRKPSDGSWVYFGDPTPDAANTTFSTLDRFAAPAVAVSPAGGFYSGTQSITLDAGSGIAVRYTLDGSIPRSTSSLYSAPISISSTDVLRARAFVNGKIPGKLETHTYFINEPTRPLPIVGFTVEPDTFFDNDLGIYDNVYKGREAFTCLEYYAPDRTPAFKVGTGTKIGGENIWRFDQKPLNIGMRGKYGDDLIHYQIFPDENIGTFDAVGFRNGGDNWPNAMLRDPISPSIVKGQMVNEVAFYRPVVLYMNGEYWGIHNARLRLGDSYFFNRYGIQPGGYDLLVKEHGPPSGSTQLIAKDGDLVAYTAFENFVENNDMTVAANYDAAVAQMDLNSFMDYCAMTDYVYESSWHHNQEFWRERKDGAKWRWNINDIDRGFNASNVTSSLLDDLDGRHPIFTALKDNTDFTNRFVQRYAAHLNSTYHPDRIGDIVDTLAAEVEPEIARHIAKWDNQGGFSASKRQAELAEIKQFAIDRISNVYSDMANIMNVANNTSDLAITVSPAAGGRILVNDVPMLPAYTMTPTMYRDIAFNLSAEAAPGYVFTGWSAGGTNATISKTLTGNEAIIANFALSGESFIAAVVTGTTTLTTLGSPYTATGDVIVNAGATLNVEPGVTISMPKGASFYVNGALNINGTEIAPVSIEPRQGSQTWGAIGFKNATGTSTLSHVTLTGSTFAGDDPVNLKAAVSALNSTVILEYADISARAPVFARGGSLTVRFSNIHPTTTGDGINVKGGLAVVEDCTILGNSAPDTDAIDFDGVTNGIITRNRIYAFRGFNSDAIDIGEGCVNLQLSENRIYNSSDKGVSVGQGSEVFIYRNLIVGCDLGVAVKDAGSTAHLDQNTFTGNRIAVSSFEKNFNRGGGIAHVTNTIFSRSKDSDTEVDSFSVLDVNYSISDTLALPAGTGNLIGDPLFTDSGSYDFSIGPASPAINTGDPGHALDADSSRADMGAYYVYDPNDYPFQVPNVIVINELLTHSNGPEGDFIELYNASSNPVDISGWFLSDSASDLGKYEIAPGTIVPSNGYVVFYQTANFGVGSADSGSHTGFGFSENGETAYLYAPDNGILLAYNEEESFGAAAADVSFGRYFKSSTNTFNFVAMETATPGAANSNPKVGPIVISEIMYHPGTGDAEYFELLNVSSAIVTLYDSVTTTGWEISAGVTYSFPSTTPVTLQAGERCLLVRNQAIFSSVYNAPAGTQIIQWVAGGLSNGGENLEISSPGDVDSAGLRQYIREDRVGYEDIAPWPVAADLGLLSLTRIDVHGYGNDPSNWVAAEPTPGQSGYQKWATDNGIPSGQSGKFDDPDDDGRSNLFEYGIGTSPVALEADPFSAISGVGNAMQISFQVAGDHPELSYRIMHSPDLTLGSWTETVSIFSPYTGGTQLLSASEPIDTARMFYRLVIE